jgi:hypothetical protein
MAGFTGYRKAQSMSTSSQQRAIRNYRERLGDRGMVRFEVLGLDADRELIRSLTRRLAEKGPDADRLRATVSRGMEGESPKTGGILEALRRSPLVGATSISPVPGKNDGMFALHAKKICSLEL